MLATSVSAYNLSIEAQLYDSSGNILTGTHDVDINLYDESDVLVYTNYFNVTTDNNGRFYETLRLSTYQDFLKIRFQINSDPPTDKYEVGLVPFSMNSLFLNGVNRTYFDNAIRELNQSKLNVSDNNVTQYLPLKGNQMQGDINMSGYNITHVGYTDFINYFSNKPAYKEGRLFYDETHKTLAYYNDDSSVTSNIGPEMPIRVRNTMGYGIYNGQLVYISGGTGHTPDVHLAVANESMKARVYGMVTSTLIENNNFGYVTIVGDVHDIDTSACTEGDTVYLATERGNWTCVTHPNLPNFVIHIGEITYAHATQGIITVNLHPEITNTVHVTNLGVVENLTVVGKINASEYRFDSSAWAPLTKNSDRVDGSVVGLNMTNPPNAEVPHFFVQSGGASQASAIVRSFMVVNEYLPLLQSENRTDCVEWANYYGTDLKIDCNTTTTGADLFVGDDAQIVGDVWLVDTDGEYHFMTRELSLRDSMTKNTLESKVNSTFNYTLFRIRDHEDQDLVVHVGETNDLLDISNDSVTLTPGTNSSPQFNAAHYTNGGSPTLTTSLSEIDNVPDVGQFLLGNHYLYGAVGGAAHTDEFIRGVYHRFYQEGAIYLSGYDINVTTDEINISFGTMKIMLDEINHPNNLSTDFGVFHIHNDGTYEIHTGLDDLSEYATGEAIGNNKFFNVVCGVVNSMNNTGDIINLECNVQNLPASGEYTTITEAETDQDNTLNYFPSSTFLKKIYLPIVRVVMKRQGGVNTIQTLDNGALYFDVRGTVSTAGGNPPTPSVTDHGNLNGLADDDHTQYLLRTDNNVTEYLPLTGGTLSGDTYLTGNLNISGELNIKVTARGALNVTNAAGEAKFTINTEQNQATFFTHMTPHKDNSRELGLAGLRWYRGWFSYGITDGTYSVGVRDMNQTFYNVINLNQTKLNASDLNTTLYQPLTAVNVTEYLPLAGGVITDNLTINGNLTINDDFINSRHYQLRPDSGSTLIINGTDNNLTLYNPNNNQFISYTITSAGTKINNFFKVGGNKPGLIIDTDDIEIDAGNLGFLNVYGIWKFQTGAALNFIPRVNTGNMVAFNFQPTINTSGLIYGFRATVNWDDENMRYWYFLNNNVNAHDKNYSDYYYRYIESFTRQFLAFSGGDEDFSVIQYDPIEIGGQFQSLDTGYTLPNVTESMISLTGGLDRTIGSGGGYNQSGMEYIGFGTVTNPTANDEIVARTADGGLFEYKFDMADYSKVTHGANDDVEFGFDGTNFIVNMTTDGQFQFYNSTGSGTIAYGNAVTFTEVNTDKNVLETFNDGAEILNEDGSINHSAFGECYVAVEVKDPNNCWEVNTGKIKHCYDLQLPDNEVIEGVCNYDPLNESSEMYGYVFNSYIQNVTRQECGTKIKDGVNTNCEVAKQRQAFALLTNNVDLHENLTDFDTGIMAEHIYTQSKVIEDNVSYLDKIKDKDKLKNKTGHYAYVENIMGTNYTGLDVEERIVVLEGAVNELFTILCEKNILKKEDGCP